MNKNIEYFMGLKYNVILKQIKGRYYLFIPDLSLIVEGDDLNKVYAHLEQEKEAYFRRVIDLGGEDTVKEPSAFINPKSLFADLASFSLKAVIFAVILAVIFVGTLPFVNDVLINQRLGGISRKARVMITQLPVQFNAKLDKISPEEREKIRVELREIVRELKPFAGELKALWEDDGS